MVASVVKFTCVNLLADKDYFPWLRSQSWKQPRGVSINKVVQLRFTSPPQHSDSQRGERIWDGPGVWPMLPPREPSFRKRTP